MTVHGRVAAARQRLRDAGIPPDEADLDARLLAQHLLGWDGARYFSAGDETADAGFAHDYDALIDRRARREPLAYITGRRQFWGLDFEVSPAVLIPRPESELIVETALEMIPRAAPSGTRDAAGSAFAIADVCTGSGCIAIALAKERPFVDVTATDISQAALDVADRNARRHSVDAGVRFVRTSLLDGLDACFDVIVSNPPYVPDGDRASVPPEVREHEPALALFAGPDGLDVIRRLAPAAAHRLKPGGALIFEIGVNQADAVRRLISSAPGLRMIDIRRDLQGIPRTVIARR